MTSGRGSSSRTSTGLTGPYEVWEDDSSSVTVTPLTWCQVLLQPPGVTDVYINADVTPYARTRDNAVEVKLPNGLRGFWGTLLHPPGSVTTKAGRTSRVFAPFFSRWRDLPPTPWTEPRLVGVDDDPGDALPDNARGSFQAGGEQAAMDRLFHFAETVDSYEVNRDRPDLPEARASPPISTSGCWLRERSPR